MTKIKGRKIKKEVKPEEKEKAVEVIKEVVVKEPHKEVTNLQDLKLDRLKIDLLKRTIAKGASDDELLMFINVAKGLGLSPFLNHVHLVPRWDSKTGTNIRSVQVGIDGFRSIAESTDAYAGNEDPIYEGEKEIKDGMKIIKVPEKATVKVKKVVQGQAYEFTASARWDEFYPGDRIGFMWRAKPHLMLGKCAEAQALRKAFPKVLGGVYAPEELEKAPEKTAEETAEDKMAKALDMIQKDTDIKRMKEFNIKVLDSKIYTKAQKNKINKAVEKRVEELQNGKPKEEEEVINEED